MYLKGFLAQKVSVSHARIRRYIKASTKLIFAKQDLFLVSSASDDLFSSLGKMKKKHF